MMVSTAKRGLPRLAVADDQLALPAADVDHGVDGLEPRLQRLAHRLPVHDAGGDDLDGVVDLGGDGALAVDGLPQGVDHAPDHVSPAGTDMMRRVRLTSSPSRISLSRP
jgi:hypothetical protein